MKAHSLLRLTNSLYNTPLLVLPHTAQNILSYLEMRNQPEFTLQLNGGQDWGNEHEYEDESLIDTESEIACIDIHGAISYRPIQGSCGEIQGVSYTGLLKQVQSVADKGVKTIILNMDSPGGTALGAFETANEVRAICDEYGIELYAYLEMMACSAGYALACVADEVVANPSAEAGSIGCVVALQDNSEAMKKAGVKRIYVTSGNEKVPFENDGTFKQSFLDSIQLEVDRLNTEFAAHVSKYTGLPTETIIGFQADTFNAYQALEKGLVNRIMTKKQFVTYIAGKQKNKGVMYARSN